MAAVYKTLSKSRDKKTEDTASVPPKNRQRVLILSSRGVTYRFVVRLLKNELTTIYLYITKTMLTNALTGTDTSSTTSTRSCPTAAKTQSSTQRQSSTSSMR